MILVKYNEIMNNVTVDPEMKSRIMSAVSASIKEQAEKSGTASVKEQGEKAHAGEPVRRPEVRKVPSPAKVTEIPKEEPEAPARKKASRLPVIISSIAAGILVIAGVMFFFNNMGGTKNFSAEATVANATVGAADSYEAAAETEAYYDDDYYAEATTTAPAENEAAAIDNDIDYVSGGHGVTADDKNKNSLTADIKIDTERNYSVSIDGSEGIGDDHVSVIAGALPFEIKGSGSGQFSDTISEEVFVGNDGEKVVIFTAPEGTDIVNEVFHKIYDVFYQNRIEGVAGTTPAGMPVTLYRIAFGNVYDLADGEVSADVNAASFSKNGNTYLIVFSDIQPVEVIGTLADTL